MILKTAWVTLRCSHFLLSPKIRSSAHIPFLVKGVRSENWMQDLTLPASAVLGLVSSVLGVKIKDDGFTCCG